MKKILSMAALALVMAGCSNDDENVKIDNGEATNAVAIQISQKVAGVESKAAITPGSTMQANIIMVDAGSGDANNPDFTAFVPRTTNTLTDKAGSSSGEKELANDAARATVANTEFKAATTVGANIELTPTLYYPVSANTKKTWILGVSPQGDVDASKVTFHDVDGLQDVMYAKHVAAGSSGTKENSIALEFEHKTSQLTFVAQLEAELTGTEWAGKTVSVTNITIQKAKVPVSIALSTGTVTTTEKNLTVAGCKTGLTTTACAPSEPVMVAATTDILVDLELSVGGTTKKYTNLKVLNASGQPLTTLEGYSHEITFTITAPVEATGAEKIATSAKIVDWKTGDAGNVTIK